MAAAGHRHDLAYHRWLNYSPWLNQRVELRTVADKHPSPQLCLSRDASSLKPALSWWTFSAPRRQPGEALARRALPRSTPSFTEVRQRVLCSCCRTGSAAKSSCLRFLQTGEWRERSSDPDPASCWGCRFVLYRSAQMLSPLVGKEFVRYGGENGAGVPRSNGLHIVTGHTRLPHENGQRVDFSSFRMNSQPVRAHFKDSADAGRASTRCAMPADRALFARTLRPALAARAPRTPPILIQSALSHVYPQTVPRARRPSSPRRLSRRRCARCRA